MAKTISETEIGVDSRLIRMCIEAAAESSDAVEAWRRQRRTLERMPSQLAEALLHRLLHRGLLFPSLLEVFRHSVEKMDLRNQHGVDAEWMAYLSSFCYLSSLNLADCYKINSSALWSITSIPNLKELDLSRCSKITDSGIRHLSSFPNLEKLCISETGVTSEGIRLLSSLTNLYHLDLGGLPVSDLALSSLQGLEKLQFLDLWGSEISNSGAALLQIFPKLSYLNLAWTRVTKLANLSSLECLNMSNCTITSIFKGEGDKARLAKLIASNATFADVSGALSNVEITFLSHLDLSNAIIDSFCFLPHLTSVTYLDLGGSPMADDSIENIVCIGAKLTYLSLNNTKVSSEGMEILAGHLPNLETLSLSGTYIDDAALSYIGMMPSLKAINLNGTKIKGLIMQESSDSSWVPSFSALQSLSHLERLELEGTQLKYAALYPFSSLNSLRYLSLQSVFLTDESLLLLSAFKKLEHLAIRDAVLTNAGLDSFTPPPTLRILDIRGGWLLTEEAIVLFSRKYPKIKLRHELVVSLSDKGDFRFLSPVAQKTSPLKNAQKFSVSPSTFDKSAFLARDQRIKYAREELLELQFSVAPAPVFPW